MDFTIKWGKRCRETDPKPNSKTLARTDSALWCRFSGGMLRATVCRRCHVGLSSSSFKVRKEQTQTSSALNGQAEIRSHGVGVVLIIIFVFFEQQAATTINKRLQYCPCSHPTHKQQLLQSLLNTTLPFSIMVADMSYTTVSGVIDSWEEIRRIDGYEKKVGVSLFTK